MIFPNFFPLFPDFFPLFWFFFPLFPDSPCPWLLSYNGIWKDLNTFSSVVGDCDIHEVCMWYPCGVHVIPMWCACNTHVVCLWYAYGLHVIEGGTEACGSGFWEDLNWKPSLVCRVIVIFLGIDLLHSNSVCILLPYRSPTSFKGVLHPWALFLKTLCVFSKNKATSDKVSYGSGQKCSEELKNHSFYFSRDHYCEVTVKNVQKSIFSMF